ncbi:hypothetical protein TETLIM4_000139 [Candidatus Hodgkinia cicadicola]|nr:hypothetical protein TETLIM4_000139 [Candidatus Hodgkinia cicadicola]
MIATILWHVATQRTIDYLVTNCLRPKRRKQQAALKPAPAACVNNTMEDLAERKMPEVKKREQKRARAKAKTVLQTVQAAVNNASNL